MTTDKRRSRTVAILASVSLHAMIILLAGFSVRSDPRGDFGPSPIDGQGNAENVGFDIALVKSLPAAGLDLPREMAVEANGEPVPQRNPRPGESDFPLPEPVEPEESHPQAEATQPEEIVGDALALDGGAAAAGNPNAQGDLLRRVARCLPPDLRPVIPLSKLVVELDDVGGLKSAPYVDGVGLATSDAIRDADRIVQAALQCGPYPEARVQNAVFRLVVDFSEVERGTLQ